jgi:predicted permease
LPDVDRVGYTDLLPLSPSGDFPPLTAGFRIAGRADQDARDQIATVRSVGADYFTTLRAPLLRGRLFDNRDDASGTPVVIINRAMASRYFGDVDPIGQRIVRGPSTMEVIGVVTDIQEGSLDTPARPGMYTPFPQRPNSSLSLVVRTTTSDLQGAPLIAAIREVRSDLVIYSPMTMNERIGRLPSAYLHRSSAWLVGAFAAIALLLGVIGLYGVISYSVGQRIREMGVRIALGAQKSALYRLVLGEAAWLIGAGTIAGLVGSVMAGMLMRQLLFAVEAWDVPTLTAVSFIVVVAALAASVAPARRASKVDPMMALRYE